MTLTHILVFSIAALLIGWLVPARWRTWTLLAASLVAVYWLQASTPIRNLDFWFPTASIALTVLVWTVTRPEASTEGTKDAEATYAGRQLSPNTIAAGMVLVVILAVGLTRYLAPLCCLTPTRPPVLWQILAALAIGSAVIAWPARRQPHSQRLQSAVILLILGLFVVLKLQPLGLGASVVLRGLVGQTRELASYLDLRWLGFSYLAFRLLHVLRDSQLGRLAPARKRPASLGEFITYTLFFPTFTAGPIDRVQRFTDDMRTPITASTRLWAGGQRLVWGVFKKFVLADSLALFALNAQNAAQSDSAVWTWVLLYAYSLRIYFDFSGYTDIALGLGRWMGFQLPENFDRPYLKTNLTAFWNSWHITLAMWFRAYYFNPLTRALRSGQRKLPVWAVVFIGQFTTMVLIGLWHGITWNFLIWGAWHGLGLFIHNRWMDWSRSRLALLQAKPGVVRLLSLGGWALTFNFVTLGWVWFALPDLNLALSVFSRLLTGW